jgi:cellulose synthase/poly-beta-1,6-N-acetylglucosamine synthase-like glycosyltransferase
MGSAHERPVISICIVSGRRDAVLDACLASLERQERAPSWELLVCAEGDPRVVGAVHARFPDARVCYVERALPGAARNLLVAQAHGELLLFLDDDVTVERDLLSRLVRVAGEHPGSGVFGGPNDTPRESTPFQVVQGAVLASIVGSGPVRRRYGAHPAGPADERFFILCNLAVRRAEMVPFAHDLVCAEENGVLAELARRGVRMHYDPELVAYHQRRATWRGFAQQMHKYGFGRGQLLRRQPGTARLAYLAPTGLLAYVVCSPSLVIALGPLALVPAAAYATAVAACAAWIARTLRRPGALPSAAALIVVGHACYGSGLLRGVLARPRPVAVPEASAWLGPATIDLREPLGTHVDLGDRSVDGPGARAPSGEVGEPAR